MACWASGLALTLCALTPVAAHAQDEADPAAPAAAGDAAMPGAAKPMNAPAADADMAGTGDAAAPAKPATGAAGKANPAPANDLAVQSLLESNPKTAREIFRVIVYLVDLRRGDAAVPLVKKLLAADPKPQQCAAIVRDHGSAVVLHVGDAEGIGADGRKLAEAIIAGARKYMHDPARLADMVKQLSHAAPEVRQQALFDLKAADSDGVVALVAALADAQAAARHPAIRDALVAFGKSAADPLIATLTTNDDRLAVDAMDVLARIRSASATAYLLGPALEKNSQRSAAARTAVRALLGHDPTDAEAVAMLEKEITARLSGDTRLRTNSASRVELWHWNDAKRTLARHDFAHDQALAIGAARLAGELAAARPAQASAQQLDVLASLQAAKLVGGVETPLAEKSAALQRAAAREGSVLEAALATALHKRYLPAAVGVIEALATVADESILIGQGDRPSALVEAVRDPERIVRFAALDAVMKVAPTRPFAGSSSVVDALAFFAASSGRHRCLVLEPRSVQARSLAGMLRDAGYDAEAGVLGHTGRMMLNASADYEFAFVDLGIGGPDAYELVGELRRDPRTASLPIGLMAGETQLPRAKRIALAFPRTMAFAQATDKKTIEYQAEQLKSLEDRLTMAPQVRQRQAEMAMAWLAQLAAKQQSIFDLSRCEKQIVAGLDRANLARMAAQSLATLGTHTAQHALVEYASQTNRPIQLRQVAASAFAKSVERHGIQLTSDEIVEQYDRYNASEKLNEATQKLLGALLDTIEAPSRSARAKEQPLRKASATLAE
jgi:CheY-like chemotaxis protein